jgi:hypothetical protein
MCVIGRALPELSIYAGRSFSGYDIEAYQINLFGLHHSGLKTIFLVDPLWWEFRHPPRLKALSAECLCEMIWEAKTQLESPLHSSCVCFGECLVGQRKVDVPKYSLSAGSVEVVKD